jgi:hypothetical protein
MIDTCRSLAAAAFGGLLLSGLASPVLGQTSTLPAPSRMMFKCTAGKKVTYTDQPCLGAKRLDVVPSRGLNKLGGTERIGADVANERHREMFAEAIKPLTGLEPQQFAVRVRRHSLSTAASRECQVLDPAIAKAEAQERSADRSALAPVQHHLFSLRKRYQELRC